MTGAVTEDRLGYQGMIERAMRGVVREALRAAAADGLPGAHHFYITFRTRAEGVRVSDALLAKYPDEMTIVLQHKFWGLEVTDDFFAVTLTFGGRSERLHVPFAAVGRFVDPSVRFALQFDQLAAAPAEGAPAAPPAAVPPGPVSPEKGAAAPAAPAPAPEAKVVTLDAFRKKS
jgi:hypothetical protein